MLPYDLELLIFYFDIYLWDQIYIICLFWTGAKHSVVLGLNGETIHTRLCWEKLHNIETHTRMKTENESFQAPKSS